ncbi:TetR/AcrR family transcriptional regulator [Starkeya koreensis]|uniref:TetR/AcrR family transcriptional regulator n=1 Tax=Ancylobacter koreensis TaxID=266121 RepID=A0ABT0DLW3_9HYPH|nr:TetR/AcrR family transcriptional regulator [Ancylobacter koreensis]MCK0208266.1 TetR/AcrR family transcriptional regulator [Ancylobacter koreensis]
MTSARTTSDAILDCAQSLIVAGGYNGFSYADIAEVVGIRKASIHHHFPAKADLVRALVARYRREAEEGLAALEQHVGDPAARLAAYLGYWEACIAEARAPICLCALLASELPVLPDVVASEVRGHFRTLAAWLAATMERGAAEGGLHLSDPGPVEAELFMASVHGAMLSARAYGDPAMFGTITRPLLHRLAG